MSKISSCVRRVFRERLWQLPLLLTVVVWLGSTLRWEENRWANLTFNELLLQLGTSIEGTSRLLLHSYILSCIIPAAVVFLLTLRVLLYLSQKQRKSLRVTLTRCSFLCLSALVELTMFGCDTLQVGEYLRSITTSSDYIEANYVDPAAVPLVFPQEKRNLVYIWLESMETTFADTEQGGAFSFNPIPNLTRLAQDNTCFAGDSGQINGAYSMYGATWTAGALFAHMSGLPLKIPVANSSMQYQSTFFPGAVTLGDVLSQQGYRQVLLLGSDATFGGRRLLFAQHGNYEIRDYCYSLEQGELPENYFVWWGYEDSKLLQNAQDCLTELAAGDAPFNLSLLTADTHFPDGYICPLCGNEHGSDQYSNVMSCSDRQVTALVEWIQAQPFYENTTIVLVGDHITMDVDYCRSISDEYGRRVYTAIINPAVTPKKDKYREYTTFDMFPTTLAALGVEIPGNRLALGVNLFSRERTLVERDGYEKMNAQLSYQSDFIDRLSGIDQSTYELSRAFRERDTQLNTRSSEETLICQAFCLEDLEKSFTALELFADVMDGDLKTTLWSGTMTRQADSSYLAEIPLSVLEEVPQVRLHLYAMTGSGRMQVDGEYTYPAESAPES